MKKYLRLMTVLALVSGFVFTQVSQVLGQSNALAITPRKEFNLSPGQSVEDTLTVTNRHTEEPLNLRLTVVDFEAQDESGTPKLMRNATDRTSWSIKNFIDIPQQVTIAPGETTRIPITISMPTDIGAGGYYSAIDYAAVGQQSDEQVNISASGVSLVFVTVPGQARQQLNLMQFGAFVPSRDGRDGSFKGLYFGEKPRVLSYRLKNDGNIVENPKGSIKVKNFSGEVIYDVADANQKDQLALRGQVRRFDACINPEDINQTTATGTDISAVVCGDTKFSPGRYTAELSLIYGSNGNETREITAKTTFWYLPWWFVGLIVLGLALIVGAGFYLWRRIDSYRNRKTRRR